MNLLAPYTNGCEMCGYPHAKHRFCSGDCIPDGTGHYVNVSTVSLKPTTPHLHRNCERCDYEWLTATLVNWKARDVA